MEDYDYEKMIEAAALERAAARIEAAFGRVPITGRYAARMIREMIPQHGNASNASNGGKDD